VVNDVPLLEWNTDKERYLTDLEAAGVAIVPTQFVAPGVSFEAPAEPFVVKPSISAGGRRSAWFAAEEADAGQALVQRIHAEGDTAMIQPYLADEDETALVYIDGWYSHSLARRVPLPTARSSTGLYLTEQLAQAEAMVEQCLIAEAALALAPGEPLYARVDLLGGAVLELELTEPSLYFAFGAGSVERVARAVAATLTR
jgi:glutathione synthase/RimK-type ligase-like ATP-grasp enzyme